MNPRRAPVALVVAWALWAVFAVWLAPRLIRSGHAGNSIALVNDVFDGRDVHPVEFYLDDWNVLALWASLVMLALSLAYLGSRVSSRHRRVVAWVVAGQPDLELRALLWYGCFLGFLSGGAQFTFRASRQLVIRMPATQFRWEEFWMLPLTAAGAGLIVAILLAIVARMGATRVGVWKATLLFGFFLTYAVLQENGIPLYPQAEIVLALGLAAVLARLVAARADAVRRGLHAVRPVVLVAFVALATAGVLSLPDSAERRAVARLPPPDASRPNVLLIVLDTVRASSLSLYGYERLTTPRLDEWATAGVVFERAYSTAPWTLPSHATMFTGRYPFETQTNPGTPLGPTWPTLAEVLASQGYATAGFVANLAYTSPLSGLARGFARYQARPLTWDRVLRSSWLADTLLRPGADATGFLVNTRKTGRHVTAELLSWLDQRHDERPFFAFLNYYDAHEPYESPDPFQTMFGDGAAESWDAFKAEWNDAPEQQASLHLWKNQYEGAIAYVDHQLGIIHESLAARGLLDNTLVVVTSDHGESWGEHGLIDHMNAVYAPLLHIPLMISLPGVLDGGARVAAPVTLRDLPATILDLVGVAHPPLPGVSLASGATRGHLGTTGATVFSEFRDMRSVVEGRLHYILNGDGIEELYDLEVDPDERENLAPRPELGTVLSRFRSTLAALQPTGRTPD